MLNLFNIMELFNELGRCSPGGVFGNLCPSDINKSFSKSTLLAISLTTLQSN